MFKIIICQYEYVALEWNIWYFYKDIFLIHINMYLVTQLKAQFFSCLTLSVGGPEGPGEVEKAPTIENNDTPDVKDIAGRAESLNFSLDNAIQTEESRWLVDSKQPLSFWNIDNTWKWVEPDMSMGAPASLWNWERDMYDMWERVPSPEEQTVMDQLKGWEIDFNHPDAMKLAEEWGMEEVLKTANIDGLDPWEHPEGIEEATPEMLEWAQNEIGAELWNIDSQISSLPQWSPQRENLEKRRWFLASFVDSIEAALRGEQPGAPFSGIDIDGNRDVLNTAMRHKWIHEDSWQADKFLMWLARSARQTPWCAWFVSYVLTEAGYNITPTLSSKAFIWETGKWHVAFYAWNGMMLGWNQSDKVSLAPIRKPVQWWIMPEDLEAWREPNKWWTPPIWAVIVFNRWGRDRNMA